MQCFLTMPHDLDLVLWRRRRNRITHLNRDVHNRFLAMSRRRGSLSIVESRKLYTGSQGGSLPKPPDPNTPNMFTSSVGNGRTTAIDSLAIDNSAKIYSRGEREM